MSYALAFRRYKAPSYENPTIIRGTIVSGASQSLKYNHDASLQWFRNRWFCLWNASPISEAVGPQSIISSQSVDFVSWNSPTPAFSDSAHANNPIAVSSNVLQWQPGTIVIDDVLHALWMNEGAVDGSNGTYVSRLSDPDGKWTNEKLNVAPATINGTLYEQAFITGDPIELSSGRILCPVIFQSRTVTVSVPVDVTTSEFFARAKLAGVLISDDRGVTWQRGGLVTVSGAEGCVWEPFISIQSNGQIRLFVRNLYAEQAINMMLYTAISTDGGTTFGSLSSANVETISSRGTIVNSDFGVAPSVMILNDNVKAALPSSKVDRRALTVWTSLDGGTFTPGFSISDDLVDNAPCYPTARIRNGKLYIVYSTSQLPSGFPSDLRTVVVDVPKYKRMRSRAKSTALISPTIVMSPYKSFKSDYLTKMSSVELVSTLITDAVSFGIFGRFDNTASCALLDCRPVANNGGFLVTLTGAVDGQNGRLSIGLYNGTSIIQVDSGIAVPINKDVYIGISINGSTGNVDVYLVVDGVLTNTTLSFGFVPVNLNSSEKLSLASPRALSTTFLAPKAIIRFIKAYAVVLSTNQHRYIQNAIATTLGVNLWSGTTTAPSSLIIDYDAISTDAGTNNSTWLSHFDATDKSNGKITLSSGLLTISGNASVSVDRYKDSLFSIRYTPLIGQTAPITIVTIGDALRYVEIIRSVDGVISVSVVNNGSAIETVIGISGLEEQVMSINVGASLTINHTNSIPFVDAFAYTNTAFIGKAYAIGYLTPENAFSFTS
jgi:hypothetical protein